MKKMYYLNGNNHARRRWQNAIRIRQLCLLPSLRYVVGDSSNYMQKMQRDFKAQGLAPQRVYQIHKQSNAQASENNTKTQEVARQLLLFYLVQQLVISTSRCSSGREIYNL